MLKNMYIKFQQNMVKLIPLRMTSRFIFCNFTNLSLFIFFLSFIDKMGARLQHTNLKIVVETLNRP